MKSISEDTVEIGKVIKTKGLRGELIFDAFVDDLSDFDNVTSLFFFQDKKYKIEYIQDYKNRTILKLESIDTIEQAEEFRGQTAFVLKKELPEEKEDEVYLRDLIGKKIYEDERYIGEVVDYFETSGTVLEIKLENGKAVLIPYAFAEKIDDDKIYVKLVEGILDL